MAAICRRLCSTSKLDVHANCMVIVKAKVQQGAHEFCRVLNSTLHSRAYLCFLLNSLFSFTFLPPPSVTLAAPSFHLSGTIT